MAEIDPTLLSHALRRFRSLGWQGTEPALLVLGSCQSLYAIVADQVHHEWPVSTGQAGFGNCLESGCTPTGLHRIHACIGSDQPLGMTFKARLPTGFITTPDPAQTQDLITTRILWLEGLEPGFNQGPGVDSRERYIYIHGTPQIHRLGQPASAGCIRLSDPDILALFAQVKTGTLVLIVPEWPEPPPSEPIPVVSS